MSSSKSTSSNSSTSSSPTRSLGSTDSATTTTTTTGPIFAATPPCCPLANNLSRVLVLIFRMLLCVFDLVSYPFHLIFEQPWEVLNRTQRIRATRENLALRDSPYYRIGEHDVYYLKDIKTVPEVQKATLDQPGAQQRALGYRPCLEVKHEYSPKEKKKIKKLVLDDYKWLSAVDVDREITTVELALRNAGVNYKDNVLIYSETRYEWFLSAHAILRLGAAVATIYANLGPEAVDFGIRDTNATLVFTSQNQIERMPSELPDCVKALVYYAAAQRKSKSSETKSEKKIKSFGEKKNLRVYSYEAFKELGEQNRMQAKSDHSKVDETLPAVILYTSGSTGKPKGVVLTHRNFMSCTKSILTLLPRSIIANPQNECWFAYLPLAHILEFIAEMAMFAMNIPIGYGSPFTMTDQSTGLAAGQTGDMPKLQPTIFPSVPLVLERIQRQVILQLESKFPKCPHLVRNLIEVLVDYKDDCFTHGLSTPLFNRLVASRFNKPFGGRLAYMLIGGAALSPETQRFIRTLLNVKVLIGYGSSETCGANLVADLEDVSLGWTGAPLYGVKARLVDWLEGGYKTTDQPYPRGELHIGGPCVSTGYYNQANLTQESFYQLNGVQWFKTGDIAQVNEQGVFRIIDRKKDLVKLQHGEYVSFGAVETELKNFPLVENVCVYGDSNHNYIIAIILPAQAKLNEEVQKWKLAATVTTEELKQMCSDQAFLGHIQQCLVKFCAKQTKLTKFEIPQKVILATEEWTPDNEMVTATLKVRRHKIYQHYKPRIDQIYAGGDGGRAN